METVEQCIFNPYNFLEVPDHADMVAVRLNYWRMARKYADRVRRGDPTAIMIRKAAERAFRTLDYYTERPWYTGNESPPRMRIPGWAARETTSRQAASGHVFPVMTPSEHPPASPSAMEEELSALGKHMQSLEKAKARLLGEMDEVEADCRLARARLERLVGEDVSPDEFRSLARSREARVRQADARAEGLQTRINSIEERRATATDKRASVQADLERARKKEAWTVVRNRRRALGERQVAERIGQGGAVTGSQEKGAGEGARETPPGPCPHSWRRHAAKSPCGMCGSGCWPFPMRCQRCGETTCVSCMEGYKLWEFKLNLGHDE